jgi:redox-sensitive bicupin YhaK (pirin superfamily)
VTITQDARVYTALLDTGQNVAHSIDQNRYAWLQLAQGTIDLNGVELKAGDGAAISRESELAITARDHTELLLFDLA